MRILKTISLIASAGLLLAGCADANQSAQPDGDRPIAQAGECVYPADGSPARPVDPPAADNVPTQGEVTATVHLSAGDVTMTLDRAQAPCTVNSFVSLAEQGYFDGTVCHRLVDTGIFVLQCGDPTATGTGGPGYTIPDEVTPDLSYPRGTVAMAKRPQPNTGGSQFFLVWADTELPPEYTVFGTMDEAGVEVIAGIAAEGVDGVDGISPIAEARIESVTLG